MLAAEFSQDQAVEWADEPLAASHLDETPVTVRPVQESDVVLIQEMHQRLSKESLYSRYLAAYMPTAEDVRHLCALEGGPGVAIVATVEGPQEKVVAMACYLVDPQNPTVAEPAILVEDRYQGRGLGRRMLLALSQEAIETGVEMFECFTHPANQRVLRLIESSGFHTESRYSYGLNETRVWLNPAS